MHSAQNIMGAGLAPLAATAIGGSVVDNLTATGATQGTALQLSGDMSVVTTAAAGTGVLLPPQGRTTPGDMIGVTNLGANALLVYPATGGVVNALAANAGFSVAAGKTSYFVARTGGLNWVANLSA